jgi:hypothetical protein
LVCSRKFNPRNPRQSVAEKFGVLRLAAAYGVVGMRRFGGDVEGEGGWDGVAVAGGLEALEFVEELSAFACFACFVGRVLIRGMLQPEIRIILDYGSV